MAINGVGGKNLQPLKFGKRIKFVKEFWEELLTYFLSIRHEPHKNDTINNSSLPWESVYLAVA
jgi:hypothetical protein